nr:DUF2190 family protein [uncultured Cohaesibacter sp.]
MAKNHKYDGKSLTLTATVAVVSGVAQLVGALFGVAGGNAAIGEDYVLHTEGAWELPCLGTDEIDVGDVLYWDAVNNRLTLTATDNTKVAIATEASAAAVTTVVAVIIPGLAA